MRTTDKEKLRLSELESYGIMNTAAEKEYDYITELAAAICNTPISLINFVGEEDTWFKSKLGLPTHMTGTKKDISFCNHTLDVPQEILQIKDTLKDNRFANSPLVLNEPKIRFYAGSPLVTPKGHVIGALCVIDHKPRELTATQMAALKTLSKKVMDNLEVQKAVKKNKQERDYLEHLLKRVSDRAPGAIFKLIIEPTGQLQFPFVSNGISKIHPTLGATKLMQDGNLYFKNIHASDRTRIKESLKTSFINGTKWEEEYKIETADGSEVWHKAIAVPEISEDGQLVWFGTFQDITKTKHYIAAIEHQNQILFEIAWEQSHVVRAPLSRIMALVDTMRNFETDDVNKELLSHIGKSATELDDIIRGIVNKSEALKTA